MIVYSSSESDRLLRSDNTASDESGSDRRGEFVRDL